MRLSTNDIQSLQAMINDREQEVAAMTSSFVGTGNTYSIIGGKVVTEVTRASERTESGGKIVKNGSMDGVSDYRSEYSGGGGTGLRRSVPGTYTTGESVVDTFNYRDNDSEVDYLGMSMVDRTKISKNQNQTNKRQKLEKGRLEDLSKTNSGSCCANKCSIF